MGVQFTESKGLGNYVFTEFVTILEEINSGLILLDEEYRS